MVCDERRFAGICAGWDLLFVIYTHDLGVNLDELVSNFANNKIGAADSEMG